jgi:deoxyribodipyrimidine photo-lyase
MWYASIWIFTLKLSWQSGADLFMRHLLDGDAASNTLSWRWVAGLQTRGKHYLARADNIERFTQGRFNPVGQLDETAEPLSETSEYPRHPLAAPETLDSSKKYLLLLSEDDCLAEYSEIGAAPVVGVTALTPDTVRFSEKVQNFKKASVSDAMNRACKHYKCEMKNSWVDSAESLAQCFTTSGADAVLSLKAPVGSTRDQFQALFSKTQIPGVEVTRAWDREHWPKASAGYFKFKKSLGL